MAAKPNLKAVATIQYNTIQTVSLIMAALHALINCQQYRIAELWLTKFTKWLEIADAKKLQLVETVYNIMAVAEEKSSN